MAVCIPSWCRGRGSEILPHFYEKSHTQALKLPVRSSPRAAAPRRIGASPPAPLSSLPSLPLLPPPPPRASQAKHAGRSGGGGGNLPRPAIGSGWRRPTAADPRAMAQAGGDQGCRAGSGDEEITSAARVSDLDPIRIWMVVPRAVVRILCSGAASGLWTRHATRGRRGSGPWRGGAGHLLRRRWSARWLWILASSPGVQWGNGVAGENRAMTRVMAGDGGVFATLSC